MEANIKNTFSKVFESLVKESEIDSCKETVSDWHKSFMKNYTSDNEQATLMVHILTKTIRFNYQENFNVRKKLFNKIIHLEIAEYSDFICRIRT
jgi:hypothetical protein